MISGNKVDSDLIKPPDQELPAQLCLEFSVLQINHNYMKMEMLNIWEHAFFCFRDFEILR